MSTIIDALITDRTQADVERVQALEAKEVGDILTTIRVLSAPWHACDGSAFDQTAYPALYAVLGGTTLPSISYSSDTTTYIKMADD